MDRQDQASGRQIAGAGRRIVSALLLSTTCTLCLSPVVLAQPAPVQTGAVEGVELPELSITGLGTGRSLGGALYGPGGAVGPVRGYVASRSTVGTKTDTPPTPSRCRRVSSWTPSPPTT